MLYARKMIGGVSPKNTFLLTTYANILPILPLSARRTDGWRPREHVAFLFIEDDEEFHNLIRKHMVMPFILGYLFPGHSEEVAGGKYCALVKPNVDDAPIPNAGGASVDANVE